MHERDYQQGEQIPGTVYRVVRLLGAGGMGTVYDVEDITIGKRYVLKTLHPQLGAREDLARRMQNEARTLARLNHPNIVEVFTAGVTADDLRLPFYVMERLNGQSLRVVLEKKGILETVHAYHIAIDLLDALDHAHDKGVIHRDVKPDNIFLHRTQAGITLTKLLDFGIMSLLDSANHEPAGKFLGTLRYAAPEQLRGDGLSPKIDVYAAALVLYEMLAGRGPFDDQGDPDKISAAHMNRPAPLLSTHVEVSPELDRLVAAALSKDPAARPRDAFSFAASLRALKRARNAAVRELTADRATAPAIVAPSLVPSSRDLPGGLGLPFDATQLPTTTLHDREDREDRDRTSATPPLGADGPTLTSAAVDRLVSTRTGIRSVAPAAGHGTDAVSIATPAPAGAPRHSLAPPVEGPPSWANERPLDRSEAPQVRSLHAAPPSQRSRSALVAALAVAAIGAVALSSRFGRRAPMTSEVSVSAGAPQAASLVREAVFATPAPAAGADAGSPAPRQASGAAAALSAAGEPSSVVSVAPPSAAAPHRKTPSKPAAALPVLAKPGPGF
jgi:serine/threonine protein kinase